MAYRSDSSTDIFGSRVAEGFDLQWVVETTSPVSAIIPMSTSTGKPLLIVTTYAAVEVYTY